MDEEWAVLRSFLPAGWKEPGGSTGTLKGRRWFWRCSRGSIGARCGGLGFAGRWRRHDRGDPFRFGSDGMDALGTDKAGYRGTN